jgi:hypothetical protein
MEDIGLSGWRQDRKRPIKAQHILIDRAVRGITCRSFIADARYCANI